MKRLDLSAATEAVVAVTVAAVPREDQPAVTDSQWRVVSPDV